MRLNIHNTKVVKSYKTFGQLNIGDVFYKRIIGQDDSYIDVECEVYDRGIINPPTMVYDVVNTFYPRLSDVKYDLELGYMENDGLFYSRFLSKASWQAYGITRQSYGCQLYATTQEELEEQFEKYNKILKK